MSKSTTRCLSRNGRLAVRSILFPLLAVCVLWQSGSSQHTSHSANNVGNQDKKTRRKATVRTINPNCPPSSAFIEPNVVRSVGGALNVTLDISVAQNNVAGRVIETGTYKVPGQASCSFTGPTLRIRPGDLMKIKVVNNLTIPGGGTPPPQKVVDCGHRPNKMFHSLFGHIDPETYLHTNIHTHGLQVSPLGNSDNPLIDLAPGETCNYSIQVPPLPLDPRKPNKVTCEPGPFCLPQPAGLYWYHPHRHMATSKQSWAGLAGAIIVEGEIDRVPEVAQARERLIILQELWVDDKGRVPAGMIVPSAGSQGTQQVSGTEVPFTANPAVPTNIYYTVNGVFQPEIPFRPGETQRWRILNASPHRVYQLFLDGGEGDQDSRYYPEMVKIAQDGINFSEAVKADNRPGDKPSCWMPGNLCLAPGNRVEVIVKFPEGVDKTRLPKLWAVPFEQGHPGGPLPRALLATVRFSGEPLAGSRMPTRLVAPPPKIATCDRTQPKTVTFGPGDILTGPVIFPINGVLFEPTMKPMEAQAGTCEEWTLLNKDVFMHPFHIHVNSFLVTEVDGVPLEPQDIIWWDTVMLPPKRVVNGVEVPGQVKIKIRYRKDAYGVTVFHCHFLPHEDNGMMMLFKILQ
jgi:FtsP/CotA-like multicopper oxidase with cupredoxin domain